MATGHSEKFRRTMAASVHRQTETSGVLRGDKVLIYEGELEIMARFAADYPSIETAFLVNREHTGADAARDRED